jgi:5-methylcytosine-specific restriction endonuclease McrA
VIDDFGHRTRSRDGRRGTCKACDAAYRKRRYAKHGERLKKQSRDYGLAHRKERSEYNKQYYADRREQGQERTRQWHRDNPGKSKAQREKFKKLNPEYFPAYAKRKYAANPAKCRAAAKASREKNIEKSRARERANYWADPEKRRAHSREWAKAHREQMSAATKKRRRENPEKHRAENRRRYAQRWKNGGSHTLAEWRALVSECGFKCLCCLREVTSSVKLEPDHIIPVTKGGPDFIWNIQPLCRTCNIRKQARAIDYRPREIRRKYCNPAFQ